MTEFIATLGGDAPRTMHAALVKLARANSPAAFAFLVQVATMRGFSTSHRLTACSIIIDRAFGRAPALVAITDDRPGLAQPSTNLDGKDYARQVYDILREAGAMIPGEPESDAIRRDDATETVVETPDSDYSLVTSPGVHSPRMDPASADNLKLSAQVPVVVEPIVVEPEPTIAAPSLARRGPGVVSHAGVRRSERQRVSIQWLFDSFRAGTIGGVNLDADLYRTTLRAALLSSSEPDARDVVDALDARYA